MLEEKTASLAAARAENAELRATLRAVMTGGGK
jgi:hypothetical protein